MVRQQHHHHKRRSTSTAAEEAASGSPGRGRRGTAVMAPDETTTTPKPEPEATDEDDDPATIPTGFRFGGGSREMHGHPIYCVSWSTDLYRRRGDVGGGVGRGTEHGQGSGADGDADDGPPPPQEESSTGATGDGDDDHHQLVRCVATCAGDHVTVYEVNVRPTQPESMVPRQAYVDADDGEVFYSCAFGGRGVDLDALVPPTTRTSEEDDDGDDDDDGMGEADEESPPTVEGNGGHRRSKRQRRQHRSSPTPSTVVIDASAPAPAGRVNTLTPREREMRYYRRLADFASYDGPQLLCCAGKRGVVKVIDTTRRALVLTLSGHGDEIYDLKFNPANEWLLATASKDESLRLWNLQTATCVAIFAGENGHRESVLSLDFHPRGTAVASSGMDNTVKLWSLDSEDMRRSITDSFEQRPRRDGEERVRRHLDGRENLVFRTRYVQMPYFSTKKMHTDYVDCVQFVGDLILSKSIANVVVLWKPDIEAVDGREGGRGGGGAFESKVIALREFQLNQCSTWFVRFHADATGRMLAVGNNVGEVKVWEIGTSPHKKHFANLTYVHCGSTVRMVSFSPDGRSLIAVCEDATVWKWDAV